MPAITMQQLKNLDETKPGRWIVLLSYGVKFLQSPLVVLGYVLKLTWNAFRFGWSKA